MNGTESRCWRSGCLSVYRTRMPAVTGSKLGNSLFNLTFGFFSCLVSSFRVNCSLD